MKSNEEIFSEVAFKKNKDFNHKQFADNNWSLYSIIINSMDKCQEPLKEELKKLEEENNHLNYTEDLLTQISLEKDERISKLIKALKMMMREHEDQQELKESLDFANDVLEQIDNGF